MKLFERELAQYFTEDYRMVKHFLRCSILLIQSKSYKKQSPVTFFSNLQKGLGNLKFDQIYQFNQYPHAGIFQSIFILKEEIERYKKWTTLLSCSLAIQWEVKHWRMF